MISKEARNLGLMAIFWMLVSISSIIYLAYFYSEMRRGDIIGWLLLEGVCLLCTIGAGYWSFSQYKKDNLLSNEVDKLLQHKEIPLPEKYIVYFQTKTVEEDAYDYLYKAPIDFFQLKDQGKVEIFRAKEDFRFNQHLLQSQADKLLKFLDYMPPVPVNLVDEPMLDSKSKKDVSMYVKNNEIYIKKHYFYHNCKQNIGNTDLLSNLKMNMVIQWWKYKGFPMETTSLDEFPTEVKDKLNELLDYDIFSTNDDPLGIDDIEL